MFSKSIMRKLVFYIIPVLVCFLVGFLAEQIQMNSILNWYPFLNKPILTPPNWAFPVAWAVIYLMMGVSAGIILNMRQRGKKMLILIWSVQLFFNFLWSVAFFYFRTPLAGLFDILCLDILVFYFIIKSYSIHKVASFLFIPYLLWILFATYLNGYIFLYN